MVEVSAAGSHLQGFEQTELVVEQVRVSAEAAALRVVMAAASVSVRLCLASTEVVALGYL